MRRLFLVAMAVALSLLSVSPASASNDPDYKQKQYGLKQVNAPSAWAKTRGAGQIIAIVDSGVDREHPDLKAKLLPGYDFGDNDNNPDDDSNLEDGNGVVVRGHGTHVAGIAAAITDNGVGMAGVAPDAKILPVKAFPSNADSMGFTSVPQAIRYAVDQGARVINLSLGTFDTGVPLLGFTQTPCSEAMNRGSLCVVASGNSGGNQASGYPRDYPGLIVTANDKDGNHSDFGQRADTQWALSAPGVAIWSTVPVEDNSYGNKQGTSMAAPHAAGVAALLFAELNPPKTNAGVQTVIKRLLETARPMGDSAVNGAGRIDAATALGVPVQNEDSSSGPSPSTTSPIPQTLNERLRQQQGSGGTPGTTPAPAATTPSGGEPAPLATGETTDPTAPNTKGIELADGVVEEDSDDGGGADGGKAMLIALGALAVLSTGSWTGLVASKQLGSKRVKAF